MGRFPDQRQVVNESRRKKTLKMGVRRVERISLVLLVWLAALGLVYGLYAMVFEKGIFRLSKVEVESVQRHVSRDDIIRGTGLVMGTNIYSIDLAKLQQQVLLNPWIKEASVARKLPSTLWIYAGEYVPAAIVLKDKLYFVDPEGTVFKEVGAGEEKDLPVITGAKSEADIEKGMALLRSYMESKLSNYFSLAEININDVRGHSFVLSHLGVVLKVGFDNVPEKLERFTERLGTISAYKEKMRYVDLNIPGKVVVKYES